MNRRSERALKDRGVHRGVGGEGGGGGMFRLHSLRGCASSRFENSEENPKIRGIPFLKTKAVMKVENFEVLRSYSKTLRTNGTNTTNNQN